MRSAAAIHVLVAACVAALAGCAKFGPTAISHGRSAYNAMINETEDQQILSIIVHQRYNDTFGILAVSSVTANLRAGGSVGANVGLGPRSGYESNLVPFSAEVIYEENPTITYVPLRGEEFIQRMLAPLSAEQTLLLSRMSTREMEVLRFLVRRVSGITNPLFSSRSITEDPEAFNRFIDLYVRLREGGSLDIVESAERQYALLLHSYTTDEESEIAELLGMLGTAAPPEHAGPITVPLRFYVGERRREGISIETPSALDVIRAAASGVDVPDEHLAEGLASASVDQHARFIRIHSSRDRPSHASVVISYKGWWFFVDSRDTPSKQAFVFLRTLIGLRLDDTASAAVAPVLTVPVR